MRAEDQSGRPSIRTLMTDNLGRLGIRSAQNLVVIALVSVIALALVQVKIVIIPGLIARTLGAALGPVIIWLRRHNVAAMLATWITLLGGAVVFGGIITLIVLAVRNQWNKLAVAASQVLDELQALLVEGPIPIDQERSTLYAMSPSTF